MNAENQEKHENIRDGNLYLKQMQDNDPAYGKRQTEFVTQVVVPHDDGYSC
jgi:hypothetical protein